ncbi:putative osmoprotectant (glycine betaine/ carnitine/choline/l-proline) ABC transporter ProW [Lentzea pudingi]|uniref:Osmoprotectant (Glycine betaine/ carnitine/choline/l-proline) ABC transporter ProW n=1 Tax=Lentzea pudingi TaxID=1789439 RepID=A0ABQ2HJF5_9PSEU|nr:ABC transporter permease [Lentzea pudingi]GGM83394.1 putative osmoprotectant (glycine betaine/ carnitine/choline/l-proline) ABC transporter ProW [Lentzea pudingi]
MTWIFENWERFWEVTAVHLRLSVVPVLAGFALSIPLGWWASRSPKARLVLFPFANVLFTIPSIALIVITPVLIGTKILDEINVIVPLTVYTVALMIRSVADALSAVPGNVVAAANAMGFRPLRRFLTVDFPLALPVTIAGLRVATVSNISMVSVGALVGLGGYGQLFTEGYQTDNTDKVLAGLIGTVVLAVLADGLLLLIGRLLTPWARVGR